MKTMEQKMDNYNISVAKRTNKDILVQLNNQIREKQTQRDTVLRNLTLLENYERIIEPYLTKATQNTNSTGFHAAIGKNFYDVRIEMQPADLYTRIVAEFSDDFTAITSFSISLAHTWCPAVEKRAPGESFHYGAIEPLPEAKCFLKRISDICWMSPDERLNENHRRVESTTADKEQVTSSVKDNFKEVKPKQPQTSSSGKNKDDDLFDIADPSEEFSLPDNIEDDLKPDNNSEPASGSVTFIDDEDEPAFLNN